MNDWESELVDALDMMYGYRYKPSELEIIVARRVVIERDDGDKMINTFAGVPVKVDPECPPGTWYIKSAER